MNPSIRVNLSRWRMREHLAWSQAGHRLAADGGVEAMNALMATAIVAWPFEGDPASAESYANLYPWQWKECVEAVESSTRATFQNANREPVPGGAL